jgi:hypothetical protein
MELHSQGRRQAARRLAENAQGISGSRAVTASLPTSLWPTGEEQVELESPHCCKSQHAVMHSLGWWVLSLSHGGLFPSISYAVLEASRLLVFQLLILYYQKKKKRTKKGCCCRKSTGLFHELDHRNNAVLYARSLEGSRPLGGCIDGPHKEVRRAAQATQVFLMSGRSGSLLRTRQTLSRRIQEPCIVRECLLS